MNTWIKIAAGVLGGIAIIASLGGFRGKKGNNEVEQKRPYEEDEISDDIFDGNRDCIETETKTRRKPEGVLKEENIKNLQEGLTKASNVLGHIGIIFNSIIKIFYNDPSLKVTPTTLIV